MGKKRSEISKAGKEVVTDPGGIKPIDSPSDFYLEELSEIVKLNAAPIAVEAVQQIKTLHSQA